MIDLDEPAPAKFKLVRRIVPPGVPRKAYLTLTEARICQMLADGFTPKDIVRKAKHQTKDGEMQNYARNTVKNLLRTARLRCRAHNTPHLIALAYSWGYVT